MRRVIRSLIVTVIFICSTVMRCQAQDAPALVLVSVEPEAFVVSRLASGFVEARAVIPRGVNPHTYEPTVAQFAVLAKARAYFPIGHPRLSFEQTWIERTREQNAQFPIFPVGQGLEGVGLDPHLWLAPKHVKQMARNIAAGLTVIFPDKREVLAQNLREFELEIERLEAQLKTILSSCKGRKFFVFHPAWQYFAADYGLEEVAIERDGKEPDAAALAMIITEAKREKAKVIFGDAQFSEASVQTVAAEVGARVEVLDTMAYDWPQNLVSTARKIANAFR